MEQSAQPQRPERIFGTVVVHDQCAIYRCNESTVAAVPIQTTEDTGVWWLCEQHADVLPWLEGVRGRHDPPQVYNLSATCRYNSLGADLPPCGGAADYLAIVEYRNASGNPQLGTVSLCKRHATGLATY